MFKSVSKREWLSLVLIYALFFIFLFPLFFTPNGNDPDSINTLRATTQFLNQNPGYAPGRHPGSPLYELCMSFIFSLIPFDFVLTGQWVSFVFAIVSIPVWFFLFSHLGSLPLATALTASIVLHPIYLWMSFAFAEDLISLVLGVLGFYFVIKNKKFTPWPALALAAAMACRIPSVGYLLASVAYLFGVQKRKDALSLLGYGSLVFFLLYLPAFHAFRFSIENLMMTARYGVAESEMPSIGWTLHRRTFLVLFFILGAMLVRLYQTRIFSFQNLFLLWVGLSSVFNLFDPFFFSVGLFLFAAILWNHRKNFRALLSPTNALVLSVGVGLLGSYWVPLRNPFSRSYFLFGFPFLYFLLAHFFRRPVLWWTLSLLSAIQMFYYFEIRPRPPFLVLWGRGFYSSFQAPSSYQSSSEYSDWSFIHVDPVFGKNLLMNERSTLKAPPQ